MKNWLKENLVLVIGLALPILLIVLFFLATVLPKSMAAPPQHNLLFTTLKYEYEHSPEYLVDFVVKNQQLMMKVNKNDDKSKNFNSKKLMTYDAKTETVREITIDLSKAASLMNDNAVLLEETKLLKLDTSIVSPDGFVLDAPNYSSSGLIGGLFGAGYHNSGYRLKKGSVAYKLQTSQPDYYNDFKFVGWVIN